MKEDNMVTIYIPTKDRFSLLKRAVDSVLTQTYDNLELIIVDDASTDKTKNYLKSLKSKNIKIFYNDISKGAPYCRNLAILNAKGKFITGLDDDDYFTKDRIEKFIYWSYLLKNPDIRALFSDSIVLKNNKKIVTNRPIRVNQRQLLYSNYIGNQVFTYTAYLKKNLFDEKLTIWQDLDCWYRLLDKNKSAIKIDNISYVMDQTHENNRISKTKSSNLNLIIEYLSKKYNLSIKEKAILENQKFNYSLRITFKELLTNIWTHKDIKASLSIIKNYLKRYLYK